VLRGLDVDVFETVIGEPEFLHHRRRTEGQMVAVADVYGGPSEFLARSGTTDLSTGFDKKRIHTGAGEIGGGHQTVVPGSDHYCVVVGRC